MATPMQAPMIHAPTDDFNGGDRQKFAKLLFEKRVLSRRSQGDVAAVLDVSYRTIGRWERGQIVEPPTRGQVRVLEGVFGVGNQEILLACGYAVRGQYLDPDQNVIALILDGMQLDEVPIIHEPSAATAS